MKCPLCNTKLIVGVKVDIDPGVKVKIIAGLKSGAKDINPDFNPDGGIEGGSPVDSDRNQRETAASSRLVSPGARRAKGRGDKVDYPADFERIWAGCSKRKGSKFKAHKAWVNVNKPDADLILTRWGQFLLTPQYKRGVIPYLSSWLNARTFDEPPSEGEMLEPKVNGHRQESFQEAQARISRERDADARERAKNSNDVATRILSAMEHK